MSEKPSHLSAADRASRDAAIDVVIPVYNAPADVARCVESVLAHTTACLMRTFPNLRGQFSACNGDWQLDASIPRPLRLVAANGTLDGSEPERKSALER